MTAGAPQERNLAHRTVLLTGATSGIGRAAALAMARQGAQAIVVGRDPARLREVSDALSQAARSTPDTYQADFTELDQVRELAAKVRDRYERIDVMASNAGGMFGSRVLTEAGFESTMQTNHLAGFLLAQLLRDRLTAGRLILTSSDAYAQGRITADDLNGDRHRYHAGRAYGTSKQANILMAREAARRWPDVLALSYHPGQVRTRIGRGTVASSYFRYNPFLRSASRGADTLVWLASAPARDLVPGGYYADRKLREISGATGDSDLAMAVWDASATAVGISPS
ncbi:MULTISPECIES: SDR family NAD(P)-dependent oxidoreductase [Streptomyces]|uniref:SDR family NAD(P)-dependent oxidoreductase n=1 Tax=Streptomyces TaxID=1883 RepID=UPI000B9EE8BC|nr:SDR family NAD(P)-dependent oxidoreductase [Streptomyces kasugaensis]